MKLTQMQMAVAHKLLDRLVKIEGSQPLGVLPFPGNIRVRLCQLIYEVDTAFARYGEAHNALVKQFGAQRPDGQFEVTDPEKLKEFNRQHALMFASESKVELTPFTVSEFAAVNIPLELLNQFIRAGIIAAPTPEPEPATPAALSPFVGPSRAALEQAAKEEKK